MAAPKREEDPLPCPSWIVSNGTNIHVAKDRSWFADDYTPVESFVEIRFGGRLPVIGMGTVNLPIKVAANKTGPTSHGTLRLENVLHVPSVLCNIVGAPVFDSYSFSHRDRAFTDPTGRQVAYCKPDTKLLEIRLSGPPIGPKVGPSPFDPSPLTVHVIGAFWPESEQTRVFTEIRRKNDIKSTLSVFSGKNEDSEQALSMLRNLVLAKLSTYEDDVEDDEDEEEGDEDEEEDDPFMGGDESHPDAQYVDHLFTEKQLRWMKGVYGSSVYFMLSYGLKFYKDEDCEEAQAIANALTMDDSDASDADFADSEHSYQEPMFETNYEPMLETNYLFSPSQVQWLQRKYGSTQNFLLIQKLDPAFGSDCDDARIRAKALMAEAGIAGDDSDASWLDEHESQINATDQLFSPLELRYVRCWYVSSRNYMAIFGYDVTIEADCKMAQAAVQNKMKGE